MLERHEEAVATYWDAHSLCRYYNRANWGLLLEKRFSKYSKMDDYQKNLDRLEWRARGPDSADADVPLHHELEFVER